MRRQDQGPRLLRAASVGSVLLACSVALVAASGDPVSVTAAVGGIGAVLAASLLGLVALVALWQRGSASGYVATRAESDDALAAAFDDPADDAHVDDAAAI